MKIQLNSMAVRYQQVRCQIKIIACLRRNWLVQFDISDWSHCILRHLPMLSLPYLDWTIQNKGIIQTSFKKFNEGSCECYNPWLGETFQEHQGDPGKTCPTFCYVDCLGGCLDIKPAQEGGRCFSEEACKYGKFIHMLIVLSKRIILLMMTISRHFAKISISISFLSIS